MRILVIEADRAVRAVLERTLVVAGYEVLVVETGAQGREQAVAATPDAIVLDADLPDVDGVALCRGLRAAGERTPLLMLSARDTVEARVTGLEAGADDYLIKPFDVRELRARVASIMRRHLGEIEGRLLRFDDVELDPDAHAVRIAGTAMELTRTEYQLLELLMLNPRRVLSSELIYERIWGQDLSATRNSLRVYIGYLRRKLEAGGRPRLIHTVRGVGYVLREP